MKYVVSICHAEPPYDTERVVFDKPEQARAYVKNRATIGTAKFSAEIIHNGKVIAYFDENTGWAH